MEMQPMVVGARVRATQVITNGYGEGRLVVEVGALGTVIGLSRHQSYPEVDWDEGFASLARPNQVEVVTTPPQSDGTVTGAVC